MHKSYWKKSSVCSHQKEIFGKSVKMKLIIVIALSIACCFAAPADLSRDAQILRYEVSLIVLVEEFL